jgi:secreted protein with Ig-like and vWFA domain
MAFFMSPFTGFAPTKAGSPIPRNTMKTNLTTLSILSVLLAACGEKEAHRTDASGNESRQRETRKGVLLTTDLPPELIEGTPRPIILPRFTSMPDARREINPTVPHAQSKPLPRQALPESPQETGPGGSMIPGAQAPPVDRERYSLLTDNIWQSPKDAPLSTFSVDVDTASYSNLRRMVLRGGRIPPDAVRLEEMVNYFDYAYPQPADDRPFAVHVDNAACPWNPDHQLVRVALKGREIDRTERAPANLVFLLDVSGSMQQPDKLPLVVESFHLLLEEMNTSDTISIVVYAGAEGLLLPPTSCDAAGRGRIAAALRSLRAGGSTNGGAGIQLAYQIARDRFKPGGINRVILATDGDFNVGVTEDGGLVRLVEENAKSNVYLSVLGFGTGNLNDGMLEAITNKGNGTCYYIDSIQEARRVFLQKVTGTLATIAKDVKVQVEFNPAQVGSYRLLGYANRMLRNEDFSNDRIDAGDIGAGHTVTAFYEIETGDVRNQPPVESLRYGNPAVVRGETAAPADASAEWLTVKLRYKQPEGNISALIEKPFTGQARDLRDVDTDFRFATSVAMTALLLRDTEGLGNMRYDNAVELAGSSLAADPFGLRAGFIGIVRRLAAQTR